MIEKMKAKLDANQMWQNYQKIFPYVKKYWVRAIIGVFITIPVGAMDAVIAFMMKPYTDVVMLEKNAQMGLMIPVVIVVFSLVQSLFNYAATYLNAWVGSRITVDLKLRLFQKMMRNEVAFFDQNSSGNVQFRFNSDVDMACNGLLKNVKLFTTRVFSSMSLIGVLLWNSWQLALIALVVFGVALYPLTKVRKRIKGVMKKTVVSGAKVMTHYNEAFGGNKIVTSYNLYQYQMARFQETLLNVFKLSMKMIKKTAMLSPLMHFIISIGIAGVIWLGGWLITTDKLTPGGFVSFITALLMLYGPVKTMGTNMTNVQMSFMAMERVFELLERDPAIKSKPNAIKLGEISGSIEYKDVEFEYVKGKPVLKNVNLSIPVGKTYAFVGNSGGGKTTLANLLPRFYDVQKGGIFIDGINIKDLELDSLREQIAIVFQDNFLFEGTIRNNIMLGNPDITQEQIDVAIKSACLDEFIASLAKGLDTEIGERGILLSGGQKQRIAIARAFIKNAPIVILDEATSALDNKSESIVQQAIYNLMKNRTVFIIAHRLSTVRHADKIVVVNYGEIVEMGSHEELVNKPNSVYASLYQTQLK